MNQSFDEGAASSKGEGSASLFGSFRDFGETLSDKVEEAASALSNMGDTLTNDQAVHLLNQAGINVSSHGNCSDRNNPNCTSLDGIRRRTIDEIINFRQSSGCNDITITGGTETGHTQGHTDGRKLDIRKTDCVTNHIQNHFTAGRTRGDGSPQYTDQRGNTFADESGIHPNRPHWDITFKVLVKSHSVRAKEPTER